MKKQLASYDRHKDHTRLNILKTQKNDILVREITKRNFQKIFDQNILKLIRETGLERMDIINIYSRFVSMYML